MTDALIDLLMQWLMAIVSEVLWERWQAKRKAKQGCSESN